MTDPTNWRADFPILAAQPTQPSLAFLDTAASSQKPQQVIDQLTLYYTKAHANVHRGVYRLSAAATQAYEQARQTVQQFIGAAASKEIIFTRGTTESINCVSAGLAQAGVQAGDEIIISAMEHHSNIVPWQVLCQQTGAQLKVIPLASDQVSLDQAAYLQLLTSKTRLVAITHASNVLGTINPIKDMIAQAHQVGAKVLIDGAQAVLHQGIDVQELDVDFYCFSGHKCYGPTGIGVLYGKQHLLAELPPYQTGGSMINTVSFNHTTYADLPEKFEAGTPNIAGAIGLAAALDYLSAIGLSAIRQHEMTLSRYTLDQLAQVKGLRLVSGSSPQHQAGVFCFTLANVHPHDVATVLDTEQVAVRAGHHCAMPLHQQLGLPATIRASLGLYNNKQDIDQLIAALVKTNQLFQVNGESVHV